jgi:hypothetical protein
MSFRIRIPDLFFLSIALFNPVSGATAANEAVDLSLYANSDLTLYSGAAAYPQRGGYVQINSVSFRLAAAAGNSHTAVVQSFSDSAVHPLPVKTASPGFLTKLGYVNVIPIKRRDVTSVYVLMNSAYGHCGDLIGELQFISNGKETYLYPLREGLNIRDHTNGSFCNTITQVQGTAKFKNVRLDYQLIVLPPRFSAYLDKIVLRGFRGRSFSGAPFIAAITLHINRP